MVDVRRLKVNSEKCALHPQNRSGIATNINVNNSHPLVVLFF